MPKAANIESWSVFGKSAVVAKGNHQKLGVIADSPAKVVRANISWERVF